MDRQENMEIEINRDSLSDYLRTRYPTRLRLSDIRPYELDELVVELCSRFNTIGEIHQALARTAIAAEEFERDYPPNNVDRQYTTVGIVTISIRLLYDDFPILRKTVVDEIDPGKVAEYKKHILPERN